MNFLPSYSSVRISIHRRTISGIAHLLLLALIFAGMPSSALAADTGLTVFKVEIETPPIQKSDRAPVRDFYLNGGEDDGLAFSQVLDIYRKKVVRNSGSDYELSILVGQVKIIRLSKKIAITRIIGLASSGDTAVLDYQTVMIGDYAVPRKIEETTVSSLSLEGKRGEEVHPLNPGILLPSHLLFGFGEWHLKEEAKNVLSTVHNMFNQSKDRNITIVGHTCDIGEAEYNLELSRKRAQSVSDYLIQRAGILRENIRIEYYGEKFPIVSNEAEEGRMKNRRVEIRFMPRLSQPVRVI